MKSGIWFKNLQVFTLDPHWKISVSELGSKLEAHRLQPCNQASMSSHGWVEPHRKHGLAAYLADDPRQIMLALGIHNRLLPSQVLRQAVLDKAADLTKLQGFAPGRKQLVDLKQRVVDELRPRAFVQTRTVRAWLDLERHRLVVDSPRSSQAEALASVLRNDLGELPAVPLQTRTSPSAAMTSWLVDGSALASMAVDDDCELVDKTLSKKTVRYLRHALDGEEIRSLIVGGKVAARLGLVWRDRISLLLTDRHAIKRLRFEAIKETDPKESADAFGAEFSLMVGELQALVDDLVSALGGLHSEESAS